MAVPVPLPAPVRRPIVGPTDLGTPAPVQSGFSQDQQAQMQMTPAEVARRRRMAEALMQNQFQAQNPLGVFAKALQGGVGGFQAGQAANAERTEQQRLAAALKDPSGLSNDQLMGLAGDSWANPQQTHMINALLGEREGDQNRNEQWAREDRFRAEDIARDDALRADQADNPIEINGQLVNPATFEVEGDYRDPAPPPDPSWRTLTPEEAQRMGYDPDFVTQISPTGEVRPTEQLTEDATLRNDWDQFEELDYQTTSVLENIDEAIASSDTLTSGLIGWLGTVIPGGWAADQTARVEQIKSFVGFNTLQGMRENSPTGGALGTVSNADMRLLTNSIEALAVEQSEAEFEENMGRLSSALNHIREKARAGVHESFLRSVRGRELLGEVSGGGGAGASDEELAPGPDGIFDSDDFFLTVVSP